MNGQDPPDSPLYQTWTCLLATAIIGGALMGLVRGTWEEEFALGLLAYGGSLIVKRRTDQRKLKELRRQTEAVEKLERKR